MFVPQSGHVFATGTRRTGRLTVSLERRVRLVSGDLSPMLYGLASARRRRASSACGAIASAHVGMVSASSCLMGMTPNDFYPANRLIVFQFVYRMIGTPRPARQLKMLPLGTQ